MKYLVLLGTCCLFAATCGQGFSPSRGIQELPAALVNNQFRRQLNTQQHILTDVQQHHTSPRQPQPYFLQQTQNIEQQKYRLPQPTATNVRFPPPPHANFIPHGSTQHFPQQNHQFQRSTQNQLYTPQQQAQTQQQQQDHAQQQPDLDLHTQNFLALRNFGGQQLGPQQSLPQRSYSNKQFQQQPQSAQQQQQQQQSSQQQQYQALPASAFQQQGFVAATQQTQQKLPLELPVPTFQTVLPTQLHQQHVQKPFSTSPQQIFNQPQQQQYYQPQQQHAPQQQHQQQHATQQHATQQHATQQHATQQHGTQQQYQLTPNLGIPVPSIFPHLQSTAYTPQQQQPFSAASQQQQPSADQEYKQKLIQKHEQFVQKQYEKSQHKVRQQHEEFVAKQQQLKQQQQQQPQAQYQQQQQQQHYQQQQPPRSRPVDASEFHLFSNALQKYHKDHPTTTTTTTTTSTTTTTEEPKTVSAAKTGNKNIYAQVKAELGKYGSKTASATKKPAKTIARDELLKQLKAALTESPQQQPLGANKTYDEMDLVLPNGQHVQVIRTTDPNLVQGQQSLTQEQLQELLAQQTLGGGVVGSALSIGGKSSKKPNIADVQPQAAKDLVLANGSKVQILPSPNPGAIGEDVDAQSLPGGVDFSSLASLYGAGGGEFAGISSGANSIASSAVISSDSDEPPTLAELAQRGLIPDGYEIEGLSSSQPKPTAAPAPQPPPKKKATYVYLEEQADGSFKIQGVKANGEKETRQTGAEVESILERIRSGEIKLPPSVQRLTLPNDEIVEIEGGNIIKTTRKPATTTTTSTSTTTTTTTTTTPPPPPPPTRTIPPRTTSAQRQYHHQQQYHSTRTSSAYPTYYSTTAAPTYTPTAIHHRSSTVRLHHDNDSAGSYRTTASPIYTASPSPSSVAYGSSTHVPVTERLSATTAEEYIGGSNGDVSLPSGSSTSISVSSSISNADSSNTATSHSDSSAVYADTLVQETEHTENKAKAQLDSTVESISSNPSEDLIQILKLNGLFAMAKYLRQSGLDSILNETGPYTLFVPTDKAFKNLLVQLGGPERAEEKFKANPRLLSGLLLHHVIPGAFEIATLQDEMTGVSLAGTQLRVNQYTMHDQEWNDVTLTTINGAMVVLNKKDIKIPQGIAHAVDRVMFPLPVGDLLQTLQSDRENRFSSFLKILYTSGLSEKLQSKGIKTYTVFAPIDKSFNDIESDMLEKLFNDKATAEEFAMKHIVPGALFSAGMRFYQVKDSLLTGKTVILQKTSAGKIKVNDAQMVTSNIPATNGVIHALDGVLA